MMAERNSTPEEQARAVEIGREMDREEAMPTNPQPTEQKAVELKAFDSFVSDEPIDVIIAAECHSDIMTIRAARFRRLANELAARPLDTPILEGVMRSAVISSTEHRYDLVDTRVSALVEAATEARHSLHAIRIGHRVDLTASVERLDAALASFNEGAALRRLGDALDRDRENGTSNIGESERGD